MRLASITFTGLLLFAVACGAGSSGDARVDACRARKPTAATGVYGCVTATNDVGSDVDPKAFPGFAVHVFTTQPPPTPDDGLPPAAATETDDEGFYEIALTPGAYWICTAFRRCSPVQVPAAAPIAKHYDFGAGPGW